MAKRALQTQGVDKGSLYIREHIAVGDDPALQRLRPQGEPLRLLDARRPQKPATAHVDLDGLDTNMIAKVGRRQDTPTLMVDPLLRSLRTSVVRVS